MILDRLSNCDYYRRHLGARFAAGFDYLLKTDFAKTPDGRYPIVDDDVFAMVQSYRTKPPAEGKWEAHRLNADIQFITHGAERMGIAPIERLRTQDPYDASKDIEFFAGEHALGQLVLVEQGSFTIFLPQDGHMPGLRVGEQSAELKKVVVKVKL